MDMNRDADPLTEFLCSYPCDHERVEGDVRVVLDKGVVVHIQKTDGVASFRILFGKMLMAAEVTLSISFFTVLLVMAVVVEDKRYAYLPYLALAVFIGNLLFELSRYRIARKFIEDVRHAG